MTPKTNSNKWTDVQLAIAAVSMTSVLAFWNMFAGPDRIKADEKAELDQQQIVLAPTATAIVITPPATPMPTMPPPGYTILFGGEAPKPQVIVVQQPSNNGGGGGNQDQGGNASAPASAPVTSSGSS
jgi:hypothetical protein